MDKNVTCNDRVFPRLNERCHMPSLFGGFKIISTPLEEPISSFFSNLVVRVTPDTECPAK